MNKPALGAALLGGLLAVLALSITRWPASAHQVIGTDNPASRCAVIVAAPWAVGDKVYRVAAAASGNTCLSANVTLTMKDPAGHVLLTFTSAAADIPLRFREVATPQAMTLALKLWIEQSADDRSTRDLPAWGANEEQPSRGKDTVFQPEPLISRANYMDRRRWGQPMFCFVQGPEHEACYAIDTKSDILTLLGTLTLPD